MERKENYDNELVSIITPVYNAERFLTETIDSVIRQTYASWELILVDDCSTDKSEILILNKIKTDDRIKYLKLDKNSGAAIARNRGIKEAKGNLIAFLDSDDIWDNTKLSRQVEFMKKHHIGFSFTDYTLISENGTNYNKINSVIHVPKLIDYNFLLKNTVILCSSVMIDKRIIGEFKMPLIRAGQDTATWLLILKRGYYGYGINENLVKYRQVKGSISSNKFKAIKRTWNLYRNVEKLSMIKSIYVFTNYSFNAFKKRI